MSKLLMLVQHDAACRPLQLYCCLMHLDAKGPKQ